MKFLPFQMNLVIFQCKRSTEKMNTALTLNNSVTYPNNNFSFPSNTCAFLTNAFHEFPTLPKERDYHSKESFQRENEHFSNFKHYFDKSQTTPSHFRVTLVHFSQKNFMKFSTFQKNMIIYQHKASTEKKNAALPTKSTVTYPKLWLPISE